MISNNIDKALNRVYKLGGIYFGDFERVSNTRKFDRRRYIQDACRAKFYCYMNNGKLEFYDSGSTYYINPQLLKDLFPLLKITPLHSPINHGFCSFIIEET